MRIPSGVTDQYIYFVAVDATDLKTRETGLTTWTVYRSRNNGAATLMTTPTINETSAANMPGVYALLLNEDMTIDAGDDSQEMCFHITHAGMAPVTRVIELYRPKITAGNTLAVDANGDGDAKLANVAHGGAAATLTLATVAVDNSGGSGDAIAVTGGTNGDAVSLTGTGTGNGLNCTGGGTDGSGILTTGGATNGIGMKVTSAGSGAGLQINATTTGQGIDVNSNGIGLSIASDASHGIVAQSSGGNGNGVWILGNGSGAGLNVDGGTTGAGVDIDAGGSGGIGLAVTSATTHAISNSAGGNGNGFYTTGSGTGSGIYALGGVTNGRGALISGQGTGKDIDAADSSLFTNHSNIDAAGAGVVTGECSGTPTTTSVTTTDLTDATADTYKDGWLVMTSGNAAGDRKLITASSFSGGTTTLTVNALSEAPAATDTFVIV